MLTCRIPAVNDIAPWQFTALPAQLPADVANQTTATDAIAVETLGISDVASVWCVNTQDNLEIGGGNPVRRKRHYDQCTWRMLNGESVLLAAFLFAVRLPEERLGR